MSPTHNKITYKNKKIKNKFYVTEENNFKNLDSNKEQQEK